MIKNWKTTLAVTLLNFAYGVLSSMQIGGLSTRDIVLMAGIEALGILCKDFNVTGR